jgi:hypothetical protein
MEQEMIICSMEEYSVVCKKLLRSLKMRSNGNPDELLKNMHDFYSLARVLDNFEVPERAFCLLKIMSQQEAMDKMVSHLMPLGIKSANLVVTRIKCVALMSENALDSIEDFMFSYKKYEETRKKIPIRLAYKLSHVVMVTEDIFSPDVYLNLLVFKKCLSMRDSCCNRVISFSTILANNEKSLTLN